MPCIFLLLTHPTQPKKAPRLPNNSCIEKKCRRTCTHHLLCACFRYFRVPVDSRRPLFSLAELREALPHWYLTTTGTPAASPTPHHHDAATSNLIFTMVWQRCKTSQAGFSSTTTNGRRYPRASLQCKTRKVQDSTPTLREPVHARCAEQAPISRPQILSASELGTKTRSDMKPQFLVRLHYERLRSTTSTYQRIFAMLNH